MTNRTLTPAFPEQQPWSRFEATESQWRDWRWQQRHALRSERALGRHLALVEDEVEGLRGAEGRFPVGVTPYYLSLADPHDPFCPVRMQVIPRRAEARVRPGELADPLGEDLHRPVPSVVHKYPDRVLLLAAERCSVYCRHCTRRRIAGGGTGSIDHRALEEAVAYIAAHPGVRDVLLSGGDPLLLRDERLEEILARVRSVRHVQIVRIGTRMPVSNPMRVTPELVAMLRRHHPLFVVTHFNHPREITPEAREACERLVDAGIPVENQTVLLRQVNSSPRIIADLCERLLTMRVRPYYLHQMDVAQGIEHLRTPLEKGVEILAAMRGRTSGLAIPHFAVDLPGGGGKVTVQPNYLVARDEREATFRNYKGELYRYPEPEERDCTCPYEAKYYSSKKAAGASASEGEPSGSAAASGVESES